MRYQEAKMDLSAKVRTIMDFPKPGIGFKDITTLLLDSAALNETVIKLCAPFTNKGITKIAGIESRGFIFGMPMAYEMNLPFIPIRKPGKLPATTVKETYSLEYGTDSIEMHSDAVTPDDKILIVDDLLATGGTMAAAVKLVHKQGAKVVAAAFVIELAFLGGRKKLEGIDVSSLVVYKNE
jgi:adenine phosphoribosyltransferase